MTTSNSGITPFSQAAELWRAQQTNKQSLTKKSIEPSQSANTSDFTQQLVAALKQTLSQFGVDPSALQVQSGSSKPSQILLNLGQAISASVSNSTPIAAPLPAPAALTAPAISTPAAVTDADNTTDDQAVAQLTSVLQKAGVDTSSLQLKAHDEVGYFPGANYTTRLIQVKAANGLTSDVTIPLFLKNPNVSVIEIESMMSLKS